jgi:hypothetical protein
METEETDYAALAGKLAGHLSTVVESLNTLYEVYPLSVLSMPFGARSLIRDAKEWAEAGQKLFPGIAQTDIIPPR